MKYKLKKEYKDKFKTSDDVDVFAIPDNSELSSLLTLLGRLDPHKNPFDFYCIWFPTNSYSFIGTFRNGINEKIYKIYKTEGIILNEC